MEPGKIKVFYFNNGSGGGVLSVIRNLLLYRRHDEIENHVIYTINREQVKEFKLPGLVGAASEQVYYYSPKWNFYHTCKKLSELLPDERAVVVANDWLELGMVSHAGLSNPVIQILHGDYNYYYDLSLKHAAWIDAYATVAEVMAENLRQKFPQRRDDIYYLPFPVPAVTPKTHSKSTRPLEVIFVGRLTREKGYDLLPLIENELRHKGIEVEWHIVGEATEVEKALWPSNIDVHFHGQLSNDKVVDLMHEMDCLLLPSLAEGMPVTLVEAMKVGLTCLVNDLPGGIQELVIDGITGYKIEKNEVSSYVKLLENLNNDRATLQRIGENASLKASAHFDPISNAARYEQLFVKCFNSKRKRRKAGKVYGSRLDEAWIPNFITSTLRSLG